MEYKCVYLGLGGNIGDTRSFLASVLTEIRGLPWITDFEASGFYRTAPISDIPQDDYVNVVCRFKTKLDAAALLIQLQCIELKHGKLPKPKNAPRKIDIDILFYGDIYSEVPKLQLPHPRWKERLFVLIPLSELTPAIVVPGPEGEELVDILALIDTFAIEERCQVDILV